MGRMAAQDKDAVQMTQGAQWRMAVIDDEPGIRALLTELFRERGWSIDTYGDGRSAFDALQIRNYDVVLLDLNMPGLPGLDVLRKVREQWPDTEVIVVTGYATMESAIEALHLDAYAYITKPFELENLVTVVENAQEKLTLKRLNAELIEHLRHHEQDLEQRVAEATRELAEANEHLAELAIRDGLTNLYNQRYFMEKLGDEVSRSLRYNTRMTLVILDIDSFKTHNDTYGHMRGNDALVIISNMLQQFVRRHDVVARFGGEEFALILIQADPVAVERICERIRRSVAQAEFPAHTPDEIAHLTVSIGYAICPSDATEVDALIERADQAMYLSKRRGKNRICSWADLERSRGDNAPSLQ